jgi:hypothetical protein
MREAGGSHGTGDRLTAVWPWLLIPLVALALFFILRAVREGPDSSFTASSPPAVSLPTDPDTPNVH